MITKELIDYVNGERALGKPDGEIRQAILAQGGWSPSDIDELFAPSVPRKPVSHRLIFAGALAFFALLGVAFLIYGKRDVPAEGTASKQADLATSDVKTFDSSRFPNQFNTFSFNYPESWNVDAGDIGRVYLTREKVMPEEDFYTAIIAKKKTYISVQDTADRYTEDTLRMIGATDIKDAKIGDKQVIGFSMKSPEDQAVNITGYVFLTKYVNKGSVIFSVTTGTGKPSAEDITALEEVVRSYTVAPEAPAEGTVALRGSDFLKREEVLYAEFKASPNYIATAWDCTIDGYSKLVPQKITEAKAQGRDLFQALTLDCLNKGLVDERSFRASLSSGLADLNAEALRVRDDGQSDAFALMEVWKRVIAGIDSAKIEELKKNIAAITVNADPAVVSKMRDTYYTQDFQFRQDIYPSFEEREKLLKKISASGSTSVISQELTTAINTLTGTLVQVQRAVDSISTDIPTSRECQKAVVQNFKDAVAAIKENIPANAAAISSIIATFKDLKSYFDNGGELTQEKLDAYTALDTEIKTANAYADNVLSPTKTLLNKRDKMYEEMSTCK